MKAAVGSKDEILSASDIKIIFSNITQIATIHQHDLLDKLHASAKDWPSANNIGEIFLQFVRRHRHRITLSVSRWCSTRRSFMTHVCICIVRRHIFACISNVCNIRDSRFCS